MSSVLGSELCFPQYRGNTGAVCVLQRVKYKTRPAVTIASLISRQKVYETEIKITRGSEETHKCPNPKH